MQWTVLYEGVEELEFGERPGTNKTSFLSNALGHSENPHVQGPSTKGHFLVIRNGAKKNAMEKIIPISEIGMQPLRVLGHSVSYPMKAACN